MILQNFDLVKISEKFLENFYFFRKFQNISILVNCSKNFDLGQIFEKFRFWSNFRKISKVSKHFDSSQIFEKFRFW